MTATDKLAAAIEQHEEEVDQMIREARLLGFEEGLMCQIKPPTDTQFRKDHKEPVSYGEDWVYVVYARSPKTAARLLEVDEGAVEEIGISWAAYEDENGELTVGYYIGRGEPRWYVYGVYV